MMTESGAEEINKTAAKALELILSAFADRAPPKEITDSMLPSDAVQQSGHRPTKARGSRPSPAVQHNFSMLRRGP